MGIILNMYITFCTISISYINYATSGELNIFHGLVSFFNSLFVVFSILHLPCRSLLPSYLGLFLDLRTSDILLRIFVTMFIMENVF